VIFGNIGVENPERTNHFAARVGEQRKINLVCLGESGKDFARIVGD
jgi:hypothetical protein